MSFWFAGLALLTALVLGGVLLATLRSYYGGRERAYLESNAGQIAALAGQLIEAGVSPAELSDQVQSWSFLLQTRIEVYDPSGALLADSGVPDTLQVVTVSGGVGAGASLPPALFNAPLQTGLGSGADVIIISASAPISDELFFTVGPSLALPTEEHGSASGVVISDTALPLSSTFSVTNGPLAVALPLAGSLQTGGSAFGYSFLLPGSAPIGTFPAQEQGLSTGSVPAERSRERAEQPIYAPSSLSQPENGAEEQIPTGANSLGRLVLSAGPAYGQAIFLSAVRAWAIAGAAAVGCAALAGLWVSRRLTRPLVALTAVTTRMASGDLAARAAVLSKDEIGALGRSFNEMADQVETTVQTLRSFVADAAHELQTPLTALRTTLELINDSADPSRLSALSSLAEAQRQRLQTLAASLLELSRLEAGGDGFNPPPTALDSPLSSLSSLAERAASRAEQAGLTFTFQSTPTDVPLPAPIQRAVENLLDNAIKFTPPGGTVTLTVSKPEATGLITICVTDTGIGIPAEDLPQVGRRFFRGHNAAAYPGSGLGLAIVQAAAARSGGAFHIVSSPSGTTATLTFPAKERE